MQPKEQTDLIGLDISSFHTITNEDKLFYGSPHYIYFRAYGSDHTAQDSSFVKYVQRAQFYGVLSGAYYFGTPKASADIVGDAKSQATQFVNALESAYGKGKVGELTPFLDLEEYTDKATGKTGMPMSSGMTARQLIDWIKAFRDHFYYLTGRRVGLYTNRYFITDPLQMKIPSSDPLLQEIKDMPLWLAEYDRWFKGIKGNFQPENMGGWSTYVMWQYAVIANADQYGLSHAQNQVDHNRVKDLSWIMPPPPITDFTLSDLGQGMLQIDVKHPDVSDYLGASVLINGVYKTWITKTMDFVTIPNLTLGISISVKLVTEDYTHDRTESTAKTIQLS
jgi:hypothetical protein